jgi:hypothetical protein
VLSALISAPGAAARATEPGRAAASPMAVAVMPRMLRLSIVPSSIDVRMLHKDEAGRKLHEQMGFDAEWNTALDQLVKVVSELKH